MKKILLVLALSTMVFATSCKKDPLIPLPTPATGYTGFVFETSNLNTSEGCHIRIVKLSGSLPTPTLDYSIYEHNSLDSLTVIPKITDSIDLSAYNIPGYLLQFEAFKTTDETYLNMPSPGDVPHSIHCTLYVDGLVVNDTISNNLFMYHIF